MARPNQLKRKIQSGATVFGTWSMTASPLIANILAHTGVDFVIFDMEHGPGTLKTLERQIYALEVDGCSAVSRLAEAHRPDLLHALEVGSQTILVSHIKDADEAAKVVDACLYAPHGSRGLSPFTRNHGYSDQELSRKLAAANAETFLGVLIEGTDGLNQLEEILRVPHLDMVYLGIYDLSQTIGVPGELSHPNVLRALRDCATQVTSAGLTAGSVAPDLSYIELLVESGYRFVSYRADAPILRDGMAVAVEHFRKLTDDDP